MLEYLGNPEEGPDQVRSTLEQVRLDQFCYTLYNGSHTAVGGSLIAENKISFM